jgi:hypothetical protein
MTATETEQKAAAPAFLQKAQDLSHFHWNERWLPLDTLVTFRLGETVGGFQRPLQERRVQVLVDQFDAGEARTIFVSKRDLPSGKSEYVVLDGQHTAAALKRVGMTHWYCRIFFGMTPEDEASRFIEYENNSRRIPGVVQHNAEVIANTTTAVAIENILKPFYLRISTAKLRSEEGFIPIASRAGFEKLLAISPAILREVIQLVVDAWGHNRESFDSRIMSGLGYLLATSKNPAETAPFDRQRLLAVLKNTTPKLIEEAIGPTGSGGAQRAGAIALLKLYVDGDAPGYSKLTAKAKTTPVLPDKFNMRKDYIEHDFWTAETIDFGRTTVVPFVAPPKPEPKPRGRRRTAVNESAPGVAASNGSSGAEGHTEAGEGPQDEAEALKQALVEGGTVPLVEAVAPEGAFVVKESDGDFQFDPQGL